MKFLGLERDGNKITIEVGDEEEAEELVEEILRIHKLERYGTEILGLEPTGDGVSPSGKWATFNIKINIRVDKKEPLAILEYALFGGDYE